MILPTLICFLVCNGTIKNYDVSFSPERFLGLPPVVEAKHNGEGGGRQHLLVVVVVQAVSCCQGKSVANLMKMCKIKV